MSTDPESTATESAKDEKDERTAERIPFDATVEVGGALGPSFEAKAIDVSQGGMHLRTTYLPELGQPVACRFDAGSAGSVLANGEVVWKQEQDKGGEFGIKFNDVDDRSAAALDRIIQASGKVQIAREAGSRVRLHIDGLGSPMRARVRASSAQEVTVGSELGFLQVGKNLDLEDADTGEKRPAHIDRVEVEIDPESRVPRLVVALRYDDAEDEEVIIDAPALEHADERADDDDQPATMAEPALEKSAPAPARAQPEAPRPAAKIASKISPALGGVAKSAKTALAMLAARLTKKREEPAQRRTTAPPPGGALHASGRKVVRAQDQLDPPAPKKPLVRKKHIALGAGAGLIAIAGYALVHKAPPPPAPVASDAPAQSAAPIEPPASSVAMTSNLPPLLPAATAPAAPIVVTPQQAAPVEHHAGHVAPFGNPAVTHGTVLRLKMDGPIERINGATQATGFLVSLPGRKSVEPAGPLAARDARIASIKVSNDNGGAELSVAFKDGVPNYQVRAKNDELEIVLAPAGKVEDPKKAVAAKPHDLHHAKPHKK